MDYQTKITVDASKALRDLERLEKVFHGNDIAVSKFKDELKKINKEQALLANQTKRLADVEMKSDSALAIRIKRRKELSLETIKYNALIGNEIKNTKHLADMNRLANSSTAKLSNTYKKYGIQLNATNIFMKKLSGNTSLFVQKQRALNSEASKTRIILNANSVAATKYSKSMHVASVSNARFGQTLSGMNAFLRIQLVLFRSAMLIATAYSGTRLYIEFNKTAESIDLLNRKLMTFTGEADALDTLKASAVKTGFALQDMGRIVTRFAVTTKGAFDTKQLTKWTEGLVMSARATGTTTQELNNALIQLSQSFSAGFLMGDEYRSISENLPLFKLALQDVANEAGLAGDKLKELSSGRKIDIDLMTKALTKLSDESAKYIFALDNIDAAQGRLKNGWDIWVNSIADSKSLKNSLNFISGVFYNLSGDQASITAFAQNFRDMVPAVEAVTKVMRALFDVDNIVFTILGELYDLTIKFIKAMYDYAIPVATVTGLMYSYSAATSTAAASNVAFGTSFSFMKKSIILFVSFLAGVAIGSYLKNEFLEVELAGIALVRGLLLAGAQLEKGFSIIWANITSGFYAMEDLIKMGMGNILSDALDLLNKIPDKFNPISKESITHMRGFANELMNSSSGLDKLTKKVKNAEDRLASETKKIIETTDAQADYAIEKYNTTKALEKEGFVYNNVNTNMQKYKDTLSGLLKDYDSADTAIKKYEASMDELFDVYGSGLINLKEFERIEKLIIQARDKSISKAGELSKTEKALAKIRNDAKKGLEDYYQIQKEVNKEIVELKNPFDIKVDVSDDLEKLYDQIELLKKGRDAGISSEKDYQLAVKKTKDEINELINLKQTEAIDEVARSYDKVRNVTYKYSQAMYELNELKEADKISTDALTRSTFELERALNSVLAKAGELSGKDQIFKGMKDGLDDFSLNTKTVFEEMSELTTKSFNSMTDVLADFVQTGKLDFSSLVDSIIKDLARIAIQESITKPLAAGLSAAIGGWFAPSAATPAVSFAGMTSLGVNNAPTLANGGIFNSGKLQAFANGGIVNKPTIFPFADGTGLMGEEGPEAIMPLTKKNGKLGVDASGSGSITNVNVYNNAVNTQATTKESTDSQGNKTIDIMIEEKVNQAIKNGGLDRQMKTTYGTIRRGY